MRRRRSGERAAGYDSATYININIDIHTQTRVRAHSQPKASGASSTLGRVRNDKHASHWPILDDGRLEAGFARRPARLSPPRRRSVARTAHPISSAPRRSSQRSLVRLGTAHRSRRRTGHTFGRKWRERET